MGTFFNDWSFKNVPNGYTQKRRPSAMLPAGAVVVWAVMSCGLPLSVRVCALQ